MLRPEEEGQGQGEEGQGEKADTEGPGEGRATAWVYCKLGTDPLEDSAEAATAITLLARFLLRRLR